MPAPPDAPSRWVVAPTPGSEGLRLAAVAALGLVGSAPEERFDRITRLAAQQLGAPAVLLNLLTADRQWTKSACGAPRGELPIDRSLCALVVEEDEPLTVTDLAADPRLRGHPAVAAGWRSYAGLPLHDLTGQAVGTLCVLSPEPRELDRDQLDVLRSLATWAEAELNARVLADRLVQLSDTEQHLRALLDAAPAAVLLVEDDGTVAWGSSPATQLFGDPLAGRAIVEVLPSLDLRELAVRDRRHTDAPRSGSRTGHRQVQAGLDREGTAFPAEVTASVVPGTGVRHVVFVRDLRGDTSAQDELAQLQQRTGIVLDALAEGVFVLDPEGRVAFSNLAGARMLRRRRRDIAGLPWHELLHPQDCPTTPCVLADPLALAGRRVSPVPLARPGAAPLQVELSVRMVLTGADQASAGSAGVVVTVDDLTERLRVDRLKDELVSSVSHELRTPLTSLRGSLGLLAAGVVPADSPQGRRMVEVAVESTDRLRRLVDDILELERLHAGRVELVRQTQQVGPLLALAAQSVSGLAVASGVVLEVADSTVTVDADADRIVQVLVNLLGNAVKFSPSGSRVRLSASAVGDRARIAVADSGRGIPPEQLERVFDRFAQVDASDAREKAGTGLGLAIAQGLARQHDGGLSVTSTVGVGSTFVLDLPLAEHVRRAAGAVAS